MSPYHLKCCLTLLVFFSLIYSNNSNTNVGTTLFSETDVYKECWSSEDISILTTRMVLEDLLPTTNVLIIDNNEFISDIIQYFRLILEVIRKETYGKTKHITLIALTDLLGGYMNHAVLPIARYAYYAGIIDYMSIEKLLQLFDELKWFLRTNGQGWAPPIPQDPYSIAVERITVQPPTETMTPCNGLIFFEMASETPGKKTKDECDAKGLVIPLPFFDAKHKPVAIAVPFRAYPMRNIESKCAAYLVMKYYVAGAKCLISKHGDKQSIEDFRNNLYTWINKEVLPKLEDEKFYSAFGGVLRVSQTLKHLGAKEIELNQVIHKMNLLTTSKNDTVEAEISKLAQGKSKPSSKAAGEQHLSKKSIILMAMLITICVWFLIGTIFICYRMRKAKGGYSSASSDSSKKPPSTPSKSSRSCFGKKDPSRKKGDRGKPVEDTSESVPSRGDDTSFPPEDATDDSSKYPEKGTTANACHMSLTGEYAREDKRGTGPYAFNYDDFETSSSESSSRASDMDTEGKSGLSK